MSHHHVIRLIPAIALSLGLTLVSGWSSNSVNAQTVQAPVGLTSTGSPSGTPLFPSLGGNAAVGGNDQIGGNSEIGGSSSIGGSFSGAPERTPGKPAPVTVGGPYIEPGSDLGNGNGNGVAPGEPPRQ